MYRARSILHNISPFLPGTAAPERFACWLLGKEAGNSRPVITVISTRSQQTAASDSFLNGSSGAYIEDMYNSWLADPKSVHVVGICDTCGRYLTDTCGRHLTDDHSIHFWVVYHRGGAGSNSTWGRKIIIMNFE